MAFDEHLEIFNVNFHIGLLEQNMMEVVSVAQKTVR
jgi:hypothetical protein